MINRAEFRFNDSISIEVASPVSSTTIYLKMRGVHSEQTSLYPISGFPRNLIAEDMIKGTSLAMTIKLHSLIQKSETRLGKRAVLIKERRYGVLAVASDPNVALSGHSDDASETPERDTQYNTGEDGKDITLARAERAENTGTRASVTASTGRATNSRTSSQILVSQPSGDSSPSASKAVCQRVSIADLRTQDQVAAQDGQDGSITIEGGDELAKTMSVMLPLGSNGAGIAMKEPDFGSDDSDGPPFDEEEVAGGA